MSIGWGDTSVVEVAEASTGVGSSTSISPSAVLVEASVVDSEGVEETDIEVDGSETDTGVLGDGEDVDTPDDVEITVVDVVVEVCEAEGFTVDTAGCCSLAACILSACCALASSSTSWLALS